MNESALNSVKLNHDSNSTLESPFAKKNGLLEFKEGLLSLSSSRWSFITHLYGEQVFIDHYVLTFADRSTLENYAEALRLGNAQIVEGQDSSLLSFVPIPTL
jgi:hypothetical protein